MGMSRHVEIFEDLNIHFKDDANRPLSEEELTELASSGDAAVVLALIGDAALDLAIVQILWDSSLSKTGDLTTKRKKVVSNKNLAIYCEEPIKSESDGRSQNRDNRTPQRHLGRIYIGSGVFRIWTKGIAKNSSTYSINISL